MAELVYPTVIKIVKGLWRYLGLEFTVYGEANIPRTGSAILAINHIGYLDFAIAGTAALPAGRYVRFMAKREIFDHPIAGPLMRGMHHISVDRSNGSPSFVAALRALADGEIIGVFPEATISRTFELKEMKSGVIRLAVESGAPIIPAVIWGSQRVWTKRQKRNLRRNNFPITVAVGTPFYVDKDNEVSVELERLREKMSDLLTMAQQNYPDIPNGESWAPPRLGGTAPTAEQLVDLIAAENRAKIERNLKGYRKAKRR
jgi:1-acyl-sn-glycerol-3-phosphate acyltransferase